MQRYISSNKTALLVKLSQDMLKTLTTRAHTRHIVMCQNRFKYPRKRKIHFPLFDSHQLWYRVSSSVNLTNLTRIVISQPQICQSDKDVRF